MPDLRGRCRYLLWPVERTELTNRFSNLVGNWTRLVATQTRLVGFVSGYAQASTVVPVLIVLGFLPVRSGEGQ